jgi:hypothetical protein
MCGGKLLKRMRDKPSLLHLHFCNDRLLLISTPRPVKSLINSSALLFVGQTMRAHLL